MQTYKISSNKYTDGKQKDIGVLKIAQCKLAHKSLVVPAGRKEVNILTGLKKIWVAAKESRKIEKEFDRELRTKRTTADTIETVVSAVASALATIALMFLLKWLGLL